MTVESALLFGRCVRIMRIDAAMTQGELAGIVGLSRPAVTHMETGRTPPSWYTFIRLETHAESARVSVIDLFRRCVVVLKARGITMRNGGFAGNDGDAPLAVVDRVVGRCLDELCEVRTGPTIDAAPGTEVQGG